MKLYSYFRSSSSWRVRIALNYKGLPYETVPVHLLRGGGEQRQPAYRAINPQGMVPVLEVPAAEGEPAGGPPHRLAQSLAILEYLEETHPAPPLLPYSLFDRARARQLAEIVNSSIQPYQTVAVLRRVADEFEAERVNWARPFIAQGLEAFEAVVADRPAGAAPFCVGDHPTFADLCLIPQLFAARRFETDLSGYPTCLAIEAACSALPAFAAALPQNQPDAE